MNSKFLGIQSFYYQIIININNREVPQMCINVYDGWPSKLVGGGKARWNRGEPTDDSSMR